MGAQNEVLTDPAFTIDQARASCGWTAEKGRKLTDIFIAHGHGDHWFAAGLLAERFVGESRHHRDDCADAQQPRRSSVSLRQVFSGTPPSPVTAVIVPANRSTLKATIL